MKNLKLVVFMFLVVLLAGCVPGTGINRRETGAQRNLRTNDSPVSAAVRMRRRAGNKARRRFLKRKFEERV